MPLLKRDNMHAVTHRFRSAWNDYTKKRSQKRERPMSNNVSPKEFRAALSLFGIDSAAKLAETIGCRVRQASSIWGDPQKLTAERQRILLEIAESECARKLDAMLLARDLARQAQDDESQAFAGRAESDYISACKGYAVLSGNRYRVEVNRAARLEFQARALLESFNALTDNDRRLVLRTIDGMLSRYTGTEAKTIRHMLGKTNFGHNVSLVDLANLVTSYDEYAQHLLDVDAEHERTCGESPELFVHETLQEYSSGAE